MHLTTFGIRLLKYMGLMLEMLLMVEKGIRCQIFHFIDHYVKDNNKYMKDSDKNKESSCVKYWDVKHLKGWEVS